MDKGVFEHLGKAGKDIFFIECTEKFRRDKDVFCRIESTDFVFIPLKLIPVFPPTAASTAPKSVVGMLMYLIPRFECCRRETAQIGNHSSSQVNEQ